MAADPLAAMAHAEISGAVAGRRKSLSDAVARRRCRQSGSADCRGREGIHRFWRNGSWNPADRTGSPEFGGDTWVVRGDPLEFVRNGSSAYFRHHLDNPRISVLGGARLLRHRNYPHATRRPRPDGA